MKIFRQGDVCLMEVAAIPTGLKASKRTKRLVLLEGEATGHFHIFQDAHEVRMYQGNGGRYIEVGALSLLSHDEHSTVEVPPGKYFIPVQVEYTPAELRQVAD